MCRFLLVRSQQKIKPAKFLQQFADVCQESRAPGGDWQGDGWGVAVGIQSLEFRIQNWKVYKSLKPIWEDTYQFQNFGETNVFAIHARSAGFPQHKGNVEFNQPFISEELCFVFNGMIQKVRLSIPLKGTIGAQKIFSLILDAGCKNSMTDVLERVNHLITQNSERIVGMNIGLIYKNTFFILCQYADNQTYFGLHYFRNDSITLVCSEEFGSFGWRSMKKGEILGL